MTMSPLSTGAIIGFCVILSFAVDLAAGKNVLCYATNWAQYRPGQAKFRMSDVDPSKCTHMLFAFAKVVGNRLATVEVNDPGNTGQYMQFTNLKRTHPQVKAILAVGGWNHGGAPFSSMAATAAGRAEFVRTSIDYLRQYNFDGLDLDWEFPTASDKGNLALLLQELRAAFDAEAAAGRPPLMLLMAVSANIEKSAMIYDVPALNRYLDLVSVMTYDFHGHWDKTTGLMAPLNAPPGDDFSITVAMNWWASQGIAKNKLCVGLSLYGRVWTLQSRGSSAIGSNTVSPPPKGRFTREPGVLAHYEICEKLNQGFQTVLDPLGQTNYAYKDSEWFSYDDTTTLGLKAQYILDNNFGGAMVWAAGQDDFKGEFCGMGRYPLISVVANKLLNVGPSAGAGGNPPNTQQTPQLPRQPAPQLPRQPAPQLPWQPAPQLPRQPTPQLPRQLVPQPPQQQLYPPRQPAPQPPQQPIYLPRQPVYPPQQTYYPFLQPVYPPYRQQTHNPQQYPRQPQTPYYPQQVPQTLQQPNPSGGQPLQPASPQKRLAQGSPPLLSPGAIARREPGMECPPVSVGDPNRAPPPAQDFNCPRMNGKWQDSTSCEFYYFCLFQVPFRQRCPTYMLFNPWTKNCECVAVSTFRCPISV